MKFQTDIVSYNNNNYDVKVNMSIYSWFIATVFKYLNKCPKGTKESEFMKSPKLAYLKLREILLPLIRLR